MKDLIKSLSKPALLLLAVTAGLALTPPAAVLAQDDGEGENLLAGFELRAIGPAFMSGRIADVAIHPTHPNTWYVAVGSGGVWKTVNAGTTWEPIFDDQPSYSIGSVTIDARNPNIVWVGTGENVGGRHVGYGDGVYVSYDGGKSWAQKGLDQSEHISKIVIHPDDSNVLWVAAQGPLWRSGNDRGLYKTTDGGETWTKTLGDDEWVGVTDILIDPRDSNILYAATWQRHRNVAAYMGGGPGSGVHRSDDGGETWKELASGLPTSNMGKIGLAMSYHNPDVVYAAIELDQRTGGVYRSADRGEAWTKMSDAVAGATGPHYYQELYASPHAFDRIYLVDNRIQISDDGGKTFRRMNEDNKHGDNHSIAFRADDPDYMLIGTDGGLYETFDLAKTWRYIANLPLTQYYKVAVDDAEPFYNIYGGTQDNGTQGGPSRTDSRQGIQNSDWRMVLDWDGHQPATEPGNPDIIYAERQQGQLSRIDMSTGEMVDVQPQPGADEPFERYNWDAPILVSPHEPSRIYFASYRLWRSDNRGDSWTAISGDLTRNEERIALPIMGRVQSVDNPWDLAAMSTYNTITSIAESPIQEGLIYTGTDDGLIQVTEDGGANWRAIEVGSLPGVPSTAFVNDIKADLFDADVVYVALDNHKFGDFAPYLYKSSDRGGSWQSIVGDLPERHLVWRMVQDHVDSDLLFAGTEFGIFASMDGGVEWHEVPGAPTISFRDLAIQRRENDLVGASFGRSFYVLDDYSALRSVDDATLSNEATLFAPRDAWWYVPRAHLGFGSGPGSQGDAHFIAPNPPFGAVFTYYLNDDDLKTLKETRQGMEADIDSTADVPFPGWDALDAERRQADPALVIAISDASGSVVRRIEVPVKAGFNRVAWDLRYPAPNAIQSVSATTSTFEPTGFMAAPGTYQATLSKRMDGTTTELSGPVTFEVKPLRQGALTGSSHDEVAAFWREVEDATRRSTALSLSLANQTKRAAAMGDALSRSTAGPGDLDQRVHASHEALLVLESDLNGSRTKRQIGEKRMPTVGSRLFTVSLGVNRSTYGPTPTHREQLQIALTELAAFESRLAQQSGTLDQLGQDLIEAGAPWVEGSGF